jgi:YVTN family beta-propeller protein
VVHAQSVVATVTGLSNPEGVAYDSGKGEVFVANFVGPSSVSVISDTTNAVVATVTGLGLGLAGVVYDSAKGEIFVTSSYQYDPKVSVISDATNAVVATVPLGIGSSPNGMAYDSAKGVIFVANYASNTVSMISDSTNAFIGNITVGTHPVYLA